MPKKNSTFTQAELERAVNRAVEECMKEAASLQLKNQAIDAHTLNRATFYLRTFFLDALPKKGAQEVIAWQEEFVSDATTPAVRAFNYGLHAGFGELGLQMPERGSVSVPRGKTR